MKKNILNKVFKIINKDNIISIIYYGNRKGHDIDLCIIVNTPINYQKKTVDELDITIFNEKYFLYLTGLLDPLVTEPVLTGSVVYGKSIGNYRTTILNSTPSKNVINHLCEYANLIFEAAKKLYLEKKYIDSMTNILFCLSYITYANYYKQATKVILFQDLISINRKSLLNRAFTFTKKRKIKIKKLAWFIPETEFILCAGQK
jgi:hypothetical protein